MTNAVLFSILYNWLPLKRRTRAVCYAIFTMVVYGTPLLLSNPGGELFGPQARIGIPLFAATYALNGAMLSWCGGIFQDWVQANSIKRTRLAYVSCMLFSVPAWAMVGGILFELITETIPEIRRNW